MNAYEFMGDLRSRIAAGYRFQITTDGLGWYIGAIEDHFGADVDFAQLIKLYGTPDVEGPDWYKPGKVIGTVPTLVSGNPDMERVSTSHVERNNLNLRTHLKRFARLTLGFSEKLENLKAAVDLYMAWYNFCRIHTSLKVTPCMEAGVTSQLWTIEELLNAGAMS